VPLPNTDIGIGLMNIILTLGVTNETT